MLHASLLACCSFLQLNYFHFQKKTVQSVQDVHAVTLCHYNIGENKKKVRVLSRLFTCSASQILNMMSKALLFGDHLPLVINGFLCEPTGEN
jgi:hypothetical protein